MSSNSEWLEFLAQTGAKINEGTVVDTPSTSDATTRLYALTNLALIDISGPDTKKFLQGQVTCDVENLELHQAVAGAQCNPKGRVIFNFVATSNQPESITLRLPSTMVAIAEKSLGKYIVFSKAELKALDNPVVALTGSEAEPLVKQVFSDCPSQDNTCVATEQGTVIRHAADHFECWLNPNTSQTTWTALAAQAQFCPSSAWLNAEINAGRAMILPATSEEFVPQNINLVETGGVSFTKGCYTGQEVVARLHYLGKQKRHTRLAIVGDSQVSAGDSVYQQGKTQAVGKVVNASSNDQGTALLVDVTDAAFDNNSVFVGSEFSDEQRLSFQSLPYDFTAPKEN